MSYEREKEKGKRPDVTVQSKMGKGGMAGGMHKMAGGKMMKDSAMKKMATKKTMPKKKM